MPKYDKPTVVVRNVSKTYRINRDGNERALFKKSRQTEVRALQPTTFAAYAGESIGILGKNGSGKSTLLSLIAGNQPLTSGSVLVSSQPSLLGVSAALQPHLTGLENAKLGLLAKGLSPEHVEELAMPACEWADIGDAIHRPLNTYSSGMGARLKFAIATAVKPEILLVDEALATGDASFNAKAQQRMNSFLDEASTVFIVTHNAGTINKHCTRGIWLHEGEVIADGPARQTTKWYNMWTQKVSSGDRFAAPKLIRRMKRNYTAKNIVLDSEAARHLDA